jgi:hypothetical protein
VAGHRLVPSAPESGNFEGTLANTFIGDRGSVRHWNRHLVNFSVNINHCQSYQSAMLLLIGLYAALLSGAPWLRAIAIASNLAHFLVVWLWSPLTLTTVRTDDAAGGILAAMSLALWMMAEGEQTVAIAVNTDQRHRAGSAAVH